ncbi:MAG: protein O-mannosyl-transferase family [Elusimicrobiota bacterium]
MTAIEPILIFLGFFGLGLASGAPSVTFGDAGEFTAATATLGLPHAPGYPLYVLMARGFGDFLGLGNWAYRTNVFSNLCAALALAILADALRMASLRRGARIFGVFLLGFCALWRCESAVTEVFALHALLISALIWIVSRFGQNLTDDRPVSAMGLAFGLGMGNHQTILFAFPAILVQAWISWTARKKFNAALFLRDFLRAAVFFSAFFVLGLGLYFFLPLRAMRVPPLDWDGPTTWARFWHMFLRKDYGSFSLTVNGPRPQTLPAWTAQFLFYFRYTLKSLGAPALSLAALGAIGWKNRRFSAGPVFFLILFAAAGPFFLLLGNPPLDAQIQSALHRFFLESWMGLAVLSAMGVQWIADSLPHFGPVLAAILCLCPAATGLASIGTWNFRDDWAADDYGRSLLSSLPVQSSLFMDGGDDSFYTLAYLTLAQKLRPDVDLHDRGGLVFANPYGPDFLGLTQALKKNRRAQIESELARLGKLYYTTLNNHLLPGFTIVPQGLLYHPLIREKHDGTANALWAAYPERWNQYLLAAHYRDRALIAFYPVMRAAMLSNQGRFLNALYNLREAWLLAPDALWIPSQLAYQSGMIAYLASQASNWTTAEQALIFAHDAAPQDSQVLSNLGVVYERMNFPEKAKAAEKEAVKKNPEDAAAYYNLGELNWKLGRWKNAAQDLSQAARLNPANAAWAVFALEARKRAQSQK